MIGNAVGDADFGNIVSVPSTSLPNVLDRVTFESDVDSEVHEHRYDANEFAIDYSTTNTPTVSKHMVFHATLRRAAYSAHVFQVNSGSVRLSSLRSAEVVSLLDAEEAANKIAVWDKLGQGRLASFFAVYFVERSHKHLAFEAINKLLSRADVDALSAWSLVALLRSSFPVRMFLPAWEPLLNSVRRKLEDSGENATKILRGLRS